MLLTMTSQYETTLRKFCPRATVAFAAAERDFDCDMEKIAVWVSSR
jgi:hypothetical protein